jgi:outer membrane scaffolding protein for murein synthesis (MipA/OmpV family)
MKRVALAVLVSAAALPARAAELPLWEFGLGPIGLRLPDYRGSDESRSYIYPFPYFIYRGDFLRVDREGVRGILFESDRVELGLSLNGTPPTDSDKNRTRQGMPDLDPTLEIGPRLNLTLAQDRVRDWRLELRLPLRAAMALDLPDARGIGWVFAPHLSLDMRPSFLGGTWNFGVQAGPLFATGTYHRYFYAVDPQFATPERPAYSPGGGYSGTLALVYLSRRIGSFWLGGFARYDTLNGAVFEASPLVKSDHSVMAGISVAWVFSQSQQKVTVEPGAP